MENAIEKKLFKDRDKTKNEILRFCKNFVDIYVYGAGETAQRVLAYLAEGGIKCAGIVVSDKRRKSALFKGIKVYEFSELEADEGTGIILALSAYNQFTVLKNIEAGGTLKLDHVYAQTSYEYRRSYEKESFSKGFFKDYRQLDDIGRKYNTDKNSDYHNYLNKYEFFLNKFKNKEMNVLELGVYKGASIAMWEEYFPKATIYGVDINEECRTPLGGGGRIRIIIEDLSCEERVKKLAGIAPEIIIDDASHLWSHQIKAVYELLPCLPSGGVYILEDLMTSFDFYTDQYGDARISAYDFLSAVAEVVTSGKALRLERLSCDFYALKDEIEYLASQIEMMSFIEGSCVMIKR